MLDEKSTAILSAINELCPGGGFEIVEEQELVRAVPEGKGDVARILAFLEEKRLIELRYADEGTYCVRTMPAGRTFAERSERERLARVRGRREVLYAAAAGGFLGGLAAGLIVLLLALIFRV